MAVCRTKSKAVIRNPWASIDATTPSAALIVAKDHHATGKGRGLTTIERAPVDGRKVTSLPSAGAGGYT